MYASSITIGSSSRKTKIGVFLYFSLFRKNHSENSFCDPASRVVVVGDPIMAKEMLAMDGFSGRAFVNEFTLYEGENRGLINAQGKVWEEQRRFVIRQLRDFGFGKSSMEAVMLEEVNELIERFVAKKGEPIYDIKSELSLAVVNSLWSIVAGTRHSQEDPKLRHLARQLSGYKTNNY